MTSEAWSKSPTSVEADSKHRLYILGGVEVGESLQVPVLSSPSLGESDLVEFLATPLSRIQAP